MLLSCLPSPAAAGSQNGSDFLLGRGRGTLHLHERLRPLPSASHREGAFLIHSPAFPSLGWGGSVCVLSAQTGEIVALKKVALRRLEDGIPNQALREIKALQEIEDNQYVSEAGVLRHLSSPPLTRTLLTQMLPHPSPTPFLVHLPRLIHQSTSLLPHLLSCSPTDFFLYSFIHSLTCVLFLKTVQCFLMDNRWQNRCHLLGSCYVLQAGLTALPTLS